MTSTPPPADATQSPEPPASHGGLLAQVVGVMIFSACATAGLKAGLNLSDTVILRQVYGAKRVAAEDLMIVKSTPHLVVLDGFDVAADQRDEVVAVTARVLLTHVTRAVVRSTDAIGVYWGEGTLVHEPRMFLEQSAEPRRKTFPAHCGLTSASSSTPTSRCAASRRGWRPWGFSRSRSRVPCSPPRS